MYDVLEIKNVAKMLNNRTYTDYFYRLQLLARSVFKWNNLPNGIDEKWIERYLFKYGECMIYNDETVGMIVTPCNIYGNVNFYDEPVQLAPYATNYTHAPLDNFKNCVHIRNNNLCLPTQPTIELYALRLAEISRTIDININAQKTPVVILTDDKQKLTMKNVFKQWDGYEPVIYGSKNGLNLEDIKALKIDAPIVFDKLEIQKHHIWNECMSFLGVNNANMDKRERLVDDEVQANNEQIELSAQVMLKSRERACELMNEMFNLDVSVEMRKVNAPALSIKGVEKE